MSLANLAFLPKPEIRTKIRELKFSANRNYRHIALVHQIRKSELYKCLNWTAIRLSLIQISQAMHSRRMSMGLDSEGNMVYTGSSVPHSQVGEGHTLFMSLKSVWSQDYKIANTRS